MGRTCRKQRALSQVLFLMWIIWSCSFWTYRGNRVSAHLRSRSNTQHHRRHISNRGPNSAPDSLPNSFWPKAYSKVPEPLPYRLRESWLQQNPFSLYGEAPQRNVTLETGRMKKDCEQVRSSSTSLLVGPEVKRRNEDYYPAVDYEDMFDPVSKRNEPANWTCLTKVDVKDLGQDCVPRYVRTVECLTEKCFGGHYNCAAKTFTVQVLKRKPASDDSCEHDLNVSSLPSDLQSSWRLHTTTVTLCCECTY